MILAAGAFTLDMPDQKRKCSLDLILKDVTCTPKNSIFKVRESDICIWR